MEFLQSRRKRRPKEKICALFVPGLKAGAMGVLCLRLFMRLATLFLFMLSLATSFAAEPATPPPAMEAVRTKTKIKIDGVLDEAVWKRPGYSTFHQSLPKEGTKPTRKTEVWVAYDNDAIYFAARMQDSSPDSIICRLTRRDGWADDDAIYFSVDPYHDKRTGYFFGLTACGAYIDGVYSNDEWEDDSWDGIWEGKVDINDNGWTAEFRIPFSQLRFHNFDDQVWGIDAQRYVPRNKESDYITYKPADGTGFVSRFVELHGLHGIPSPTRLEFLPYVTGKGEFLQHAPGDPFNTGSRWTPGVGADVKLGLGTNLTLDGTINPDFGQVEIDPAVINLTDQETFFYEKRPFFLEGTNVFRFGIGGGNNFPNYAYFDPMFFNTRRIGRAPEGSLPTTYTFADEPSGTRILGAGKITGKLPGEITLGAVQAVTAREFADIDSLGTRSTREVEPLTSYSALRLRKEFDDGRQSLGLIALGTTRFFNEDQLRNEINSGGYVLGFDGWSFLDTNKAWVLTGYVAGSHLTGSPAAMMAVQTNSRHYFGRPDAIHIHIDSNATSLDGYTARFWLNKQKGNLLINAAFGIQTPGLDMNDLGLGYKADNINGHVEATYRWTVPHDIVRDASVTGTLYQSFDFDGVSIARGMNASGYAEFANYTSAYANLTQNFAALSDTKTRGGPLMQLPASNYILAGYNSDSRLSYTLGVNTHFANNPNRPLSWGFGSDVTCKITNSLYVEAGPYFDVSYGDAQYVTTVDEVMATSTYGHRYIFATIDQRTLAASIRVNWTFTPDLSIQCFIQPYIITGLYRDFKELVHPSTYAFNQYGVTSGTIQRSDGNVVVDPDGSGAAPQFVIADPNFSYRSFRLNAVLRWEYFPGSTLYFVWTQTRAATELTDGLDIGRDNRLMFGVAPDNVFLLKVSFWIHG